MKVEKMKNDDSQNNERKDEMENEETFNSWIGNVEATRKEFNNGREWRKKIGDDGRTPERHLAIR